MTNKPIIRLRAKADIRAARKWYEKQLVGLGKSFVNAVEQAIAKAAADPMRFPEVRTGYRRVLVDGFPYKVIFGVKPNSIVVVAIYHVKRDPSSWQARIDEEEI